MKEPKIDKLMVFLAQCGALPPAEVEVEEENSDRYFEDMEDMELE